MKGVGEHGDDAEVRQGLGAALNMCVNLGERGGITEKESADRGAAGGWKRWPGAHGQVERPVDGVRDSPSELVGSCLQVSGRGGWDTEGQEAVGMHSPRSLQQPRCVLCASDESNERTLRGKGEWTGLERRGQVRGREIAMKFKEILLLA